MKTGENPKVMEATIEFNLRDVEREMQMQGLTLDIAGGNLLRLGKDGVILAASHGTRLTLADRLIIFVFICLLALFRYHSPLEICSNLTIFTTKNSQLNETIIICPHKFVFELILSVCLFVNAFTLGCNKNK